MFSVQTLLCNWVWGSTVGCFYLKIWLQSRLLMTFDVFFLTANQNSASIIFLSLIGQLTKLDLTVPESTFRAKKLAGAWLQMPNWQKLTQMAIFT